MTSSHFRSRPLSLIAAAWMTFSVASILAWFPARVDALDALNTVAAAVEAEIDGDADLDVDSAAAAPANSPNSADAADPKPDKFDRSGARRTAVIIPFKEDINPLSGALLKRKFADAVESGVDVIIFDIDSPGGFTFTTFELMDMVLDAKDVETVAYIEKNAISGAALLALSTDTILMKPEATFGDAGEIVMGQDGMFRYTEAKSRSVLAQKARNTAEATGRPMALAEKLTDKDMIVYQATNRNTGETAILSDKEHEAMKDQADWELTRPIREAGKEMFFTVSGSRAVELGVADQVVSGKEDLARVLNVKTPIPEVSRSWVDTLVLILNNKFVTFLLLLIGLVALAVELSAPGLGVGGLVSVLCFGLFFWSRFLGGTSGWLEVILFLTGLMFIAAEIFVIPGFGVAGVSGLALTLGSLVMASRRFSMPGGGVDWNGLGNDALLVLGVFCAFMIVGLILTSYLGHIPGLNRLTLQVDLPSGESIAPAASAPPWELVEIGQTGTTVSALRPGGRVEIEEMLVDVVTEGDYVAAGETVRIIAKQGSRVVVRVA